MPPRLSDHLRAATAPAHARLESALDLLHAPLCAARFRRVLEGFHGFHAGWEAALRRQAALAALAALAPPRLGLLREDLLALGRSGAEIDSLPVCETAATLLQGEAAALGSVYVLQGSTLGGQVIARALAAAPWRPAAGLRYFDPHGPATGARWRAFKAALDARAAPGDWAEATQGAVATFDTLRDWLGPAVAEPSGDRS